MKKIYLVVASLFISNITCFAQFAVPDNWLSFPSGGNDTYIREGWGLNISGNPSQPVKIANTSLLVGYGSQSEGFGVGNALISGRLGIGTTAPASQLHVLGTGNGAGSIFMQNNASDNYSGLNLFDENGNIAGSCQYGNSATGDLSNTFFLGNRQSGSTVIISGLYPSHLATFLSNGNVGIGVDNPQNKLDVNGIIHSRQVNVDATGWPDFVFEPSYRAMALSEVGKYLKKNRHLPEIPSAAQIEKEGINLGEMNAKLLKKVEELTLYLLDQDKRNKAQQLENAKQQGEINLLKSQVRSLSRSVAKAGSTLAR